MSQERNPLYQNALDAIRIGVEDFIMGEPPRLASAVRNLTTGLLLLCKEKLRRLSPDDEILIWKHLKPVPGGTSAVKLEHFGQQTVDVNEIKERFKSFGVAVDFAQLERVVKVRNQLEHHYVEKPEVVLSAFVDGFHFLRSFLPIQLGADPSTVLGERAWNELLNQSAVYAAMLKECTETFKPIEVDGLPALLGAFLISPTCIHCASSLVGQVEPDNASPFDIRFKCEACGKTSDFADWMAEMLADHFAGEAYLAIKDGGAPPTDTCPECGNGTYVSEDGQCFACGFEMPDGVACGVCNEPLSLEDYGCGDRLCSYHRYVAEKERDR
ncbi:hypothetical protein DyAD56_03525 [Dyella sp. AD56]|uniref:hypothetical protein n=1 Tax=Dyella sp. AD56 TaxID=1528744 RepID=UPI000C8186B1|nr:hypothetical protein [Dyella sp. AD56]PMQ06540.1 hypothetical protein DyAD56_03525 [Dyella sp. AD56]